MMRALSFCITLCLAGCTTGEMGDLASRTMIAETTLPPIKSFSARAPKPLPESNRALTRNFLELSFQMESGRALPRFTRFEGPITLSVQGTAPGTFNADLRALLTRLKREAGIDIQKIEGTGANITIDVVNRRAIQRILPQAACFVAPNVSSLAEFRRARRSPRTNWATLETRERLVIVLPRDVSPQEMRDCLHEELAQSLGPLNDLYHLPNSVFNDDNVHTVLTNHDMLILAATYAPELVSGMTKDEVAQALPAIFSRLNPGGNRVSTPPATTTPQSFIQAIQTALGPGSTLGERNAASSEALQIAKASGWTDNRLGFAYYTRGRVLQPDNPEAARAAYRQSDAVYARSRKTRLHRAFVTTHLAAYELSRGKASTARRLVTPYIPLAQDAQNAALLATLQLIRSEALRAEGRAAEANKQRLDSLGWARYGFGADWAVQSKLREISSLAPGEPPV